MSQKGVKTQRKEPQISTDRTRIKTIVSSFCLQSVFHLCSIRGLWLCVFAAFVWNFYAKLTGKVGRAQVRKSRVPRMP